MLNIKAQKEMKKEITCLLDRETYTNLLCDADFNTLYDIKVTEENHRDVFVTVTPKTDDQNWIDRFVQFELKHA